MYVYLLRFETRWLIAMKGLVLQRPDALQVALPGSHHFKGVLHHQNLKPSYHAGDGEEEGGACWDRMHGGYSSEFVLSMEQ